ncbi:6-phosphogluconate dehydrogenase C-terminal domain-like protein [Calocera cornea HHB12733]|uniref:phosphogluconate dehydrogenase (NADP(+)-dependent, decarboxylating) n=1 Tax=Calocera cornea HHB12733 TaxID=1353952 RepID=A0A165G9J5_9BASI|nr:6-phosphogluconate dehydrogenase C-terminal domain-like protein [Calocera cornea HHB12733]
MANIINKLSDLSLRKASHKNGSADVGVIGLGSMGGGMAFLFSEHGSRVSGFDVKQSVRDDLASKLASHSPPLSVELYPSLDAFMASFKPGQRRVIVLSLPHGETIDKVLRELAPYLDAGDVLMDGANEWWENTQRRQEWLMKEKGVHLIGLGVSGGYQAARKGPSMSPGGTKEAYALVEPLLKQWAAKDGNGSPCVTLIGPGGAGHHVKMVHNGIEQGLLGIIAEAHSLLRTQLGLSNAAISALFSRWTTDASSELRDTYLLSIGAQILRFTSGDSIHDSAGLVEDVEDKVVQDVDETEGTGYWTLREAGMRHVAVPTIAASHQMRIVSANKNQRERDVKDLQLPKAVPANLSQEEKDEFIEHLRLAVYGGTLASFVQGYGIIARASLANDWHVRLADCSRIWRAGCIIQCNAIGDLFQPFLETVAVEGHPAYENLLLVPEIAQALAKTYESLKRVVLLATETDAVAPSLSASLEWLKTAGREDLPTSFMEAEMDYFGAHNYDVKGEHRWEAKKGAHHTEFKPAE